MPPRDYPVYHSNEPVRWAFRTTYEEFDRARRELFEEAGRTGRGFNDLHDTLVFMVMSSRDIPRTLAHAWLEFSQSREGVEVFPGNRHCSGVMVGLLLLVAANHNSLGDFAPLRDPSGVAFSYYASQFDMTYSLGIDITHRAMTSFAAYQREVPPYAPLDFSSMTSEQGMAQVIVEALTPPQAAQSVPEVPLSPERRTVRLGKRISVVSQEEPSKAESPRRLKLRRDRDN